MVYGTDLQNIFKAYQVGFQLYPRPVKPNSAAGRFAERTLSGVDDGGAEERIVVWLERKDGGVWAVGRSVNMHLRPTDEPRRDDYLFEGFELDDALEAANDVLEDDVQVLERDGTDASAVKPFTRDDALKLLERSFFGRG